MLFRFIEGQYAEQRAEPPGGDEVRSAGSTELLPLALTLETVLVDVSLDPTLPFPDLGPCGRTLVVGERHRLTSLPLAHATLEPLSLIHI